MDVHMNKMFHVLGVFTGIMGNIQQQENYSMKLFQLCVILLGGILILIN